MCGCPGHLAGAFTFNSHLPSCLSFGTLQEEEQRESRLSAVKRKFEDSPILSKVRQHLCV